MDGQHLYVVLSLAFGLGMLHALDADHIMAVSGLASSKPDFANCLRFCGSWAVGHGLTLFVIGFAVFILGFAIPQELSQISEHLVGVVLIFIGAWVLWDIYRKKTHFHYHQHDDLPRHAHWHQHSDKQLISHQHDTPTPCQSDKVLRDKTHKHEHGAIMVGVLHGMAGSAPLLAIIPLSQYSSPVYALLYLLLFALGVLVSMLIFGGIIAGIFSSLLNNSLLNNSLLNKGDTLVLRLRIGISCGAVVMGGVLLYSGLTG